MARTSTVGRRHSCVPSRSPVASRATGCTPGKSPMTTYRVRYQTRGDGHVPRAEKTPSDQKFSRW